MPRNGWLVGWQDVCMLEAATATGKGYAIGGNIMLISLPTAISPVVVVVFVVVTCEE